MRFSTALKPPLLFALPILSLAFACDATDGDDQSALGEISPTPHASGDAPLEGGGDSALSGLRLPNLQVMPFRELYIEGDPAGARVLRFSTTVLNAGEGPFEVVGNPSGSPGEVIATQRIARNGGDYDEHDVGRIIFHPAHEHWHVEDFTALEIWSLDEDGEADEIVATTGKGTFCAVDEVPELERAPPPAYLTCGQGVQGISAGWSDTYGTEIAGQEVDISGLDDGVYAIRSGVDPEDRLAESDDADNDLVVLVEISGTQIIELEPAPG
jgi:hypothetical protein